MLKPAFLELASVTHLHFYSSYAKHLQPVPASESLPTISDTKLASPSSYRLCTQQEHHKNSSNNNRRAAVRSVPPAWNPHLLNQCPRSAPTVGIQTSHRRPLLCFRSSFAFSSTRTSELACGATRGENAQRRKLGQSQAGRTSVLGFLRCSSRRFL